jgi:hypothetical protein
MKSPAAAVVCAVLALVRGLVSGIYWIRAARLPVKEPEIGPPSFLPLPPPPPPGQKTISMLSIGRFVGESGELNWKAAAWSIAAVILSALSSLLSAAGI